MLYVLFFIVIRHIMVLVVVVLDRLIKIKRLLKY